MDAVSKRREPVDVDENLDLKPSPARSTLGNLRPPPLIQNFPMESVMRGAKASLALCVAAASVARSDVLYSNLPSDVSYTTAGQVAQQTYTVNKDPSNGVSYDQGSAIGDDYNTGYSSIQIASLTFYGGTDPNHPDVPNMTSGDRISINFYNQHGVFSTALNYSAVSAETAGNGLHTINFPERTIPGNGFLVIEPAQVTLVNLMTGVRVKPNAGPPVYYTDWGRTPTTGAGDGGHYITVSANTAAGRIVTVHDASDTINPAQGSTLSPVGGVSSSFLQFQLNGTGNGPSLISEWSGAGGGAWSSSTSWATTPPNATDSIANFRTGSGSITGPVTVTVDAPQTVGTIAFDNASTYTIAGPQTITLGVSGIKSAAINVSQGSHVISAPVTLASNTSLTVADAIESLDLTNLAPTTFKLNKAGLGTVRVNAVRCSTLNVSGGRFAVLPSGANSSTGVVNGLAVSNGASLELNNNKLVLDYAGSSPAADIRSMIIDGRLVGGPTTQNVGIGYGEASDLTFATFGGVTLDSSAILARRTYLGDSTLDGTVNFDDLVKLAQNYNGTGKVWTQGDFTYDGIVNFDDLVKLAQNYNRSLDAAQQGVLGEDFSADFALAQAFVPEPIALSSVMGAVVLATSLVRRNT